MRDDITTRNGLLYRTGSETSIPVGEADAIAAGRGFTSAEHMVRELEKGVYEIRKGIVKRRLAGAFSVWTKGTQVYAKMLIKTQGATCNLSRRIRVAGNDIMNELTGVPSDKINFVDRFPQ